MEEETTNKTFGVGLIGVDPGRSWAAIAHIPALRAQPENFRIVGIANSTPESGRKAAAASGIERAFDSVADLVSSDEVDVVVVTVKVPQHLELVTAALNAGKHVYCEWTLGNGLEETRQLTELARSKGVHTVIGTQARMAPEILYVRDLVADGYIGNVLSTTLVSSGFGWGETTVKANSYTLDAKNGATLLTIPFAHTLAAVEDVLGEVDYVSAELSLRRTSSRIVETGENIPVTSPDQVLVIGALKSGVPLAAHYRGGKQRSSGLRWEINGSEGDILVTAMGGHAQMFDLSVFGGRGEMQTVEPLPLPGSYASFPELDTFPTNVALMYARLAADLREGSNTAPSFNDALRLHRVIAAIEQAAQTGNRIAIEGVK